MLTNSASLNLAVSNFKWKVLSVMCGGTLLGLTTTLTPVALATASDMMLATISSSCVLATNKQSCSGGPVEKRSRAAACILARSPQASSHWRRYDFQHRAGSLGTCTSFIFKGSAGFGKRFFLLGKRSAMSWIAAGPEPVVASSSVTSDIALHKLTM